MRAQRPKTYIPGQAGFATWMVTLLLLGTVAPAAAQSLSFSLTALATPVPMLSLFRVTAEMSGLPAQAKSALASAEKLAESLFGGGTQPEE
jgi:hypothetical protein